MNEAAKYFINRFGFTPKKPVQVLIFAKASIGHYDWRYNIFGTMPKEGEANQYRNIRGHVHEYTHLVQYDVTKEYTGKSLAYTSQDKQGLVESYAKYFEAAFTGIPYDPYMYNPLTGIKNFSDYSKWTYKPRQGKEIAFVLASTWWHLRQNLGDEIADNLVYESMKFIKYKKCAAASALDATLEADISLYNGTYSSIIEGVFSQHNIYKDTCYKKIRKLGYTLFNFVTRQILDAVQIAVAPQDNPYMPLLSYSPGQSPIF
jgi:hypothetical protein